METNSAKIMTFHSNNSIPKKLISVHNNDQTKIKKFSLTVQPWVHKKYFARVVLFVHEPSSNEVILRTILTRELHPPLTRWHAVRVDSHPVGIPLACPRHRGSWPRRCRVCWSEHTMASLAPPIVHIRAIAPRACKRRLATGVAARGQSAMCAREISREGTADAKRRGWAFDGTRRMTWTSERGRNSSTRSIAWALGRAEAAEEKEEKEQWRLFARLRSLDGTPR